MCDRRVLPQKSQDAAGFRFLKERRQLMSAVTCPGFETRAQHPQQTRRPIAATSVWQLLLSQLPPR